MPSQGGWSVLQQSQDGVPQLLVRFNASDRGYSLALTDLTTIWEETLSNQEITTKAEEAGCSISPGDDIDQLRILLDKIKVVLGGHEGTTVGLEPGDVPEHVALVLSAPLPRPLLPFTWRALLKPCEPRELKTAIISPLLQLAYRQQNETLFLVEQLHHKDHVISKLLDRMESANIHLTDVFLLPNIRVSKQRSQRDQFAKHVPGLAAFQPDSARHLTVTPPTSNELYSMIKKMPQADVGDRLGHASNIWWKNIRSASQRHVNFNAEASMDLDDNETDDDDFQTQEIPHHVSAVAERRSLSPPPAQPPSLTASHPVKDTGLDEDAETIDEDVGPNGKDEPLPVMLQAERSSPYRSSAKPSPSPAESLPRSRRLGVIGGPRPSKAPVTTVERTGTKSPSPVTTVTSTLMSSPRKISPTPPLNDSSPVTKPYPVKRRIGVIGGRARASQVSSQALPEASRSLSQASHKQHQGEDPPEEPKQIESPPEISGSGRSRLDKHEDGVENVAKTRETSEERANRKREELKQQLQTRPPAKKKRRF